MIYEHKISNTESVVEMYDNVTGKFMHQTWVKLIGVKERDRMVLRTFTHRDDGPAVVFACGYKAWYLNGSLHRTDGPAFEFANGNKYWYLNGKFHRIDGPAIEYANGYKSWYINSVQYSEDDFNQVIEVLWAV